MAISPNMSLIIWDDPGDPYDHNELAANWTAVDNHDHSSGNGVQIPKDGIVPGAVDGTVLAPDSVTSNHIVNQTIQRVDLADGIIGAAQIDPNLFGTLAPLGMVVAWFRPSTSFAVPTGWVIADGQVVGSTSHSWTGVGNVSVPDLRGKFILGAAVSGTGTGPDMPPAEKAIGGANNRVWNHSHSVDPHFHTVNDHTHNITAHTHSISTGGVHNHNMHSRGNAFLSGIQVRDIDGNVRYNGDLQSLYVAGFNEGATVVDAPIPTDGGHNHGGGTGGLSSPVSTGGASPNTDSKDLTTDSKTTGGDIRPAYVGLLYIIKVKY